MIWRVDEEILQRIDLCHVRCPLYIPSRYRVTSIDMLSSSTVSHTDISRDWRICVAVWSLITIILGLTGNIFVLHACIRHDAIKFGRVSVIFIKNIAFADICNILLVCAATAWTPLVDYNTAAHFYDETALGKVLCFAMHHMSYWCPFAAGVMICSLNICKLMCLHYPLRGIDRMAKLGYLVVGVSWVLYLPRLLVLVWDGVGVKYNSHEMR